MSKKYYIRFGLGHRYLKSFTTDEKGNVADITTTDYQTEGKRLELDTALEYKTELFKFLKPEIVEEGTVTIFIPSNEDYERMYKSRLEKASNEELCDELISRFDYECPVSEIRERLGFCFGGTPIIHYTDEEKEVDIEEVFKQLKYGYKSFINGLTQYQWQCNEHIEVIELGLRNGHLWIHERYVLDFKYKTPLEMLTDKNIKFPTTGYKEGFICEKIFFGNTHDYVARKNGKTIIKPRMNSDYIQYEG